MPWETPAPTQPKPPLPYEELTDIIDLALWAGQLLLQYGAESSRIEETVHHIGTGLGCDWMDILVSPNAIIATTVSNGEFRTKVRRVVRIGVDFDIVDAINDYSHRVYRGELNRTSLRHHLSAIATRPRNYDRWLTVGMVGLACGAFSQLFGGDWLVFLVTVIAAAFAMFIRQELTRRHFNPLVVTGLTAFSAGIIASSATLLDLGNQPQTVLAASVLLLVPGVPLINAAEDLMDGHILVGVARGVTGALISLAIAVGLSLAMRLMGVNIF